MEDSRRPMSLVLAAVLTLGVALVVVVLAGISLGSGHGQFSQQIAAALSAYAVVLGTAAWALWRRHPLGRGPVVALSLLNAFVAAQYVSAEPVAWLLLAASVATVVAGLLPSTTRALGSRGDPVS